MPALKVAPGRLVLAGLALVGSATFLAACGAGDNGGAVQGPGTTTSTMGTPTTGPSTTAGGGTGATLPGGG